MHAWIAIIGGAVETLVAVGTTVTFIGAVLADK